MPATGMIFTCGPAQITCDRSGQVHTVAHLRNPRQSYLAGVAVGSLQIGGTVLEPPAPEVLPDVDEVEFVYSYPERLRLVVRHTFAAGWGLRLAFSNVSDQPMVVERAELRIVPDPGCVAWALGLGVTCAYAVSPATGAGPLLGGVLRRGSVDQVTPDGLELSSFELRPGARYVHQMQWDWYDTPAAFGRDRCPEAPSALFVTTGETVHVRVDEDVAVLAPAGVETSRNADQLEVVSEAPGIFPFELRSSRGTSIFDLQWVPPVQEALVSRVPEALSRPRSAAGVVKLAGVADALMVQHALAANQVDDPEEAAEALDRLTARLAGTAADAATPLEPLEVVYLCREYDRLGDTDLLAEATRAILARTAPVPGLAIAATQLCLELIVTGRPTDEVLGHLLRLAAGLTSGPQAAGSRPVPTQAAELELIAVTHAGPGVSGALVSPEGVLPRITALGLHLGAGLKGRAVTPLPVADLSHLVTVMQLLPDGLSAELRSQWGCSAHTLARCGVPELLARLERGPIGEAHAWLVLLLQTG